MNPLVVTGYSALTARGIGRADLAARLTHGGEIANAPPTLPPQTFSQDAHPGARAYEVPFSAEAFLGDKGIRTLDRLTKLLVVATRLCLDEAGIKRDGSFIALSPETVGFCASNAYGSLEAIHELDRVATLEDPRYINPAKFPNTVSNSASGYVSIWEDIRALNVTVSDGNTGGLDAFLVAGTHLEGERAKSILVGGGESMSEALLVAWEKLGLGTTVSSVPLAEAAAFLALELPATAAARGAKALASVTGFGSAFDARDRGPSLFAAGGEALERAIRQALRDARASSVDLVITGCAGLALFDAAERTAIERTCGDGPRLDVKRVFGETLGAGGSLGALAAVAWLAGEATPPNVPPPQKGSRVLVTSLGYYGNASALVLESA